MTHLSSAAGTARRLPVSTRWALAYAGLAGLDSWLAGRESARAHRLRKVTKPLLMPTLAAHTITHPHAHHSPLLGSTLVAQTGAWVGDLALLSESPAAFATGMAAFGVGHGAYVSGFRAASPGVQVSTTPAGRVATALAATTGPVMAIGAGRKSRPLGPATLLYSGALSTMLAHAGSLSGGVSPAGRRWSLAGAALFVASDSLLGLRSFVLSEPPAGLERAVMASYTAAQFALARGAVLA